MKKVFIFLFTLFLVTNVIQTSAQIIKLTESFETATFPPTGWTSSSQLGAKTWIRADNAVPSLFPPYPDGTYCATIDYETAGGDDWLITPQIINVASTDSLVFYFVKRYSDGPYPPDSMFVKVSTLTNSVADFTTTIQSTCLHCIPIGTQVWYRVALSLSAFTGQDIYIAFQHKNVDGHGMGLDNVSVYTPSIVDVSVFQTDVFDCDTIGLFAPPITIINNGSDTIFAGDSVSATYQVDMGTPVVETLIFPIDLAPSDQVELNFTIPYLFDQFTTYEALFAVDYLGDENVTNDTVLFEVTFFGYPEVDLGTDTIICHDASIILDAGNPGAQYNWITGENTQTIELDSSYMGLGTFTLWVEVIENSFCMTLAEIDVTWQDCTGIETFGQMNVSLMPNPTNGEFVLDFSDVQGTALIEIIDVQGKVLYSESLDLVGNQKMRYDISSFPNGIYNIKISNDSYQKILKIVKQ